MTDQTSLFDLAAGRDLRDDALFHVEAHSDGDWRERAIEAVYRTALSLDLFASDDVWRTGLEKPREPRAMGPVMMRAVRLGYCEQTDQTRATTNKSQHAQPIRVYRSLLRGRRS